MRIHYYDFVATGGVHTSFNAAMIEVLCNAFPQNEGVRLHCEEEHGRIVLEKNTRNIQCFPLKALFKCSKRRKVRDFLSLFVALNAVLKAQKKDVICVGIAFPFCINALCFFSKVLKKHVYLCLHGEMQNFLENTEEIYDLKTMKYMRKMGFAFKHRNPYLSFIILGQPIYEAVKFVFNKDNHVIVINHPAIFAKETGAIRLHNPLCIGQIGSALKRKNSQKVFKLAKLLEKEIKEGLVEIKIAGYCPPNFSESDCGLVTYFPSKLDEAALAKEIESLDFTLQLTTDDVCRAIASGTLIDSLLYDKPILGLHSSYLDFYFADSDLKKYTFNSVEEMADSVKKILQSINTEKYADDVKELQKIKRYFSIEENSKKMHSEINEEEKLCHI